MCTLGALKDHKQGQRGIFTVFGWISFVSNQLESNPEALPHVLILIFTVRSASNKLQSFRLADYSSESLNPQQTCPSDCEQSW